MSSVTDSNCAPDAVDPPCRCTPTPTPPVVIVAGLASDPHVFYCAACRGFVTEDLLELDDSYRHSLRYWKALFDALYFLWLDSEEFENFAASAFNEPDARIHRMGMELASEASCARRAFYAWHSTTPDGAESINAYSCCPHCAGPLTPLYTWVACERCSVAVPSKSAQTSP